METIKVLLIEDNEGDFILFRECLKRSTTVLFELERKERLSSGLERISKGNIDIIVLDLGLPDSTGLNTLLRIDKAAPDTPVIVLTGFGDEQLGLGAVKEGAQDYLIKDQIESNLLSRCILYSIERKHSAEEIKKSLKKLQETLVEQKKAERALKESERKYRYLFEELTDAAFLANAETGIIIDTNKQGEALIGRPREEIIGMNQSELHPPEKAGRYKASFRKAAENGHRSDFDAEVIKKDGSVVPVSILATTMTLDGEKLVFGLFRDLTERKKLEEEHIKVKKFESLGALAGGIAHDFNTLLTTILGNIELAEMDENPVETHKRLTEAEKTIFQAKNLSQQLLTFSKSGAPVKKAVSLKGTIEDSVSMVLKRPDVDFITVLPGGLWDVEADESQIMQVFNSMITNAEEAMPAGGSINLRCENISLGAVNDLELKEGRYVKISIEDTGTGIPPEDLHRIFDPYFSTKQKGSGLGLALAYSIIKNHGGTITVESEIDRGAVFHVFLPASVEEQSEDKAGVSAGGKGRLMVIEDDDETRKLLGDLLANLEYGLVMVKDKEEAVALYANAFGSSERFDAVLIDLVTRNGAGDTLERLRKIDPDVKVIVSSGFSADPVFTEFEKTGFKAVILKPYKISELDSVLSRVIKGG